MPAAAVDVLAQEVADRGIMLPFANGPDDVTSTFAGRYAALTGVAAKPGMAQRLYRLDRVEPATGESGTLRAATDVWLWEDAGRPVSMAWLNRPFAGVVRVSGVYTPPALRKRGYASGCVAAVSQLALDRGALACMLYADLANPTSNRIYQRLGYYPVAEWRDCNFTRA